MDKLLGVWSDGKEGLDGELYEECITLRGASTHENNHFVIELEGVGLEFDTLEAHEYRVRPSCLVNLLLDVMIKGRKSDCQDAGKVFERQDLSMSKRNPKS